MRWPGRGQEEAVAGLILSPQGVAVRGFQFNQLIDPMKKLTRESRKKIKGKKSYSPKGTGIVAARAVIHKFIMTNMMSVK